MSQEQVILLFDGQCSLCHWAVKFLLKYEHSPIIKFAPLQSEVGKILAPAYQDLHTVVVYLSPGYLERSDALVFLASYLRMPWNLLRFMGFLPQVVRNALYCLVDCLRYPLFGKEQICSVPSMVDDNRLVRLEDLPSPPDRLA